MSTPSDITKAAEELADAVLKAAGSGLRHYTVQKTRDEIIGAAVKGLKAEREKCAKLIEDNMLVGEEVESLIPRTNPGNKVGLAYAAAIRRGEA